MSNEDIYSEAYILFSIRVSQSRENILLLINCINEREQVHTRVFFLFLGNARRFLIS